MSSKSLALPDAPDMDDEIVATLLDAVQDQKANEKKPTREEQLRDAISAMLKQLGGLTVQDDSLIFQGERFILPAQYQGKVRSAIDFLVNWEKQQRQPHQIIRTFNYRPFDGAHAFMQVMKMITGTSGFGQTKMTFFGPVHPKFLNINVDYHTTVQVPWGEVQFPSYEAEFTIGKTYDEEKGWLCQIICLAPRVYRQHIEAIFRMIEEYLSENSIYKGKAINGAEEPEYLNMDRVDPARVVYSEEVMRQLAANVWAPVRYTEKMRNLGMPIKRAVLFAGPYGTGKTLGCMLTAKEAVEHGWTFIMCRTGRDNPAEVLKTAELYAPTVVVVEDIDVHTDGGSNVEISRMLDMLDGVVNKGVEVVALFTTNHLERIQKGALRPGRIDAVIEIKGLDEAGFRKLVTLTVGQELLDKNVDWKAVAKAYQDFLPAFVAEAANRAQRYAMAENDGDTAVLTTEDLVLAADSLRPQLTLMEGAKEGANRVTIEDGVRTIVEGVISRTSNSEIGGFEVEPATVLNGSKSR